MTTPTPALSVLTSRKARMHDGKSQLSYFAAFNRAQKLNEVSPDADIRAYRCHYCSFWHVGGQNQKGRE